MLAALQDSGQQARPAASGTIDSRPTRLSGTQLTDDGTIDTPPAFTPCVQQTKGFLNDLSPELRNRIYTSIFAQHADRDHALIICAPHHDWAMTTASQPAITRVCRTVRKESLAMFYANSTFEAYIVNWDIRKLCKWFQGVSELPIAIPKITIHVKLLDRIFCEFQLLWMMRLWRDTKHDSVDLEVHDMTELPGRPRPDRVDQNSLFSHGISEADELAVNGDYRELQLTDNWSWITIHHLPFIPECGAYRIKEAIRACNTHGIVLY
ncbi:hypothetical protein KC343_g17753 [Hortaea werneckii]|nr:hypothetical protein KC352_g29204 [Hortaea werneckii]KAI7549389.1 hypothetical protein KC317_g14579 [Hortaea werneckii]KAI7593168.1 hypothetical protein KC343_g17753 [Hortaea werneckii]KAI7600795.1 hypothetical protein KC346_g13123 [Hortaea werneckii]KAI7626341.1 hypothetical protein KC319_g17549 [Hortaea werneckii]